MEANDEFDSPGAAPLPPHERVWRHPAEVHDAARQRHFADSAPPPIGRRAAALVAFVSIAASLTLMFVTVPKGIEATSPEPDGTTTTSVPVKAAVPPDAIAAVRLWGDFYVVPSEELAGDSIVISDVSVEQSYPATVVAPMDDRSLTVVRRIGGAAGKSPNAGPPGVPEDAREVTAIDRLGRRFAVRRSISTEGLGTSNVARKSPVWFPLDLDGAIDRIAGVYADGYFYAIAVRHHHENWAVRVADLEELIDDATGARP